MTQEEKELLLNPNFYDGRSRSWTPKNLASAYNLYNRITGQSKVDEGCGSCRRNVINFLQKAYQNAKKAYPDWTPDGMLK